MFEFLKPKRRAVAAPMRTPVRTPAEHAAAVGKWVAAALPPLPNESAPTSFVGFVYLDAQAGLSAKGGPVASQFVEQPTMTLRLPMGELELLHEDEVAAWKLPSVPPWLAHYGQQGPVPWRTDPALAGRFHASFIDDLEVLVHDGEPRRTATMPELCWVRVRAAEPGPRRRFLHTKDAPPLSVDTRARLERAASGTVYLATLLNQPHQLTTVKQGDPVCFYADVGTRSPLLVTTAYLAERAMWRVQPCACGMCEGLDAPSTMARTRFPGAPEGSEVLTFTAFCVACGGTQVWSHDAT